VPVFLWMVCFLVVFCCCFVDAFITFPNAVSPVHMYIHIPDVIYMLVIHHRCMNRRNATQYALKES